jgi:hypothetical protein
MDTPLPSNDSLVAYSQAVDWRIIERQRRDFNSALEKLRTTNTKNGLALETLSDAIKQPVITHDDPTNDSKADVLLTETNGKRYVLGSAVSERYRSGDTFYESLVPYNLNPSVNHTNIHETDDPATRLRVLGAELELGVVYPDGRSPAENEVQAFIDSYRAHAQRMGIYPKLDREACQYQVEAHIAPSVGYQKTRAALTGIFTVLARASVDTGLMTTVLSCYPTESDFKMTDHPKVRTAVDLMLEVNALFPEYAERLAQAQARYHVDPAHCHHVEMFRNQGCHIHIDLAGRSEALGLLTFYTILRSASAIANGAVLKGGPFVNGTCDPELLCAREYLRSTTVTGRYLDLPTSPHLSPNGLDKYASLLTRERANAAGRGMLYGELHGEPISVMHNPVGRVRSDLSTSKRVCTVESTGMPTNISASRMAAVLADFEFSHVVIESYFRKYGCDLEPMFNDKPMWAIMGPLAQEELMRQSDLSDREGSNVTITTGSGQQMRLAEFYEMKRRFMHRALADIDEIAPREIDEVYMSLMRMLEPLSGHEAQTVQQYITDPKLRSTGNWGMILRNAYLEAGGVLGNHCPDAVQSVVNQINDAMRARYLDQ